MTLDESIYEELASAVKVTAYVGARIYRGWRPQQSKVPCISFLRISTTPVNGNTGPSGTENARIQVDCWASSPATARAIADAVRDTLAGWCSTSPVSSDALLVSDTEIPVEPDEGAGQWEHRVSQDYSIWYSAS